MVRKIVEEGEFFCDFVKNLKRHQFFSTQIFHKGFKNFLHFRVRVSVGESSISTKKLAYGQLLFVDVEGV
jgi:hypothetical protein